MPVIDGQHRRLLQLINRFGRRISSKDPALIDKTLAALADYAVYHFASEEEIMLREQVAAAHVEVHHATHQRFVAQINEWQQRRARQETLNLQQLLDFLVNWLIFHILGDDQALGRQVAAIHSGATPEAAFAADHCAADPRTEILLVALRRLYSNLIDRNDDLLAAQQSLSTLNLTLEQRVIQRTRELINANQRLREEQQKLLEAEKMASLGRTVAGFAHELNTPIGIAVGAASHSHQLVGQLNQLLRHDQIEEEILQQNLDLLNETADLTLRNLHRAAEMVRRFKRSSVDQSSEQERPYELAEIIEDVQKDLSMTLIEDVQKDLSMTRQQATIDIETQCPAGLQLYGPAGALRQVLLNLLQNSCRHAFDDGTRAGKIHINAKIKGGRVFIEFSDDGIGMSEETLQHAFEPFYTTRRATGGSGLGLYIAYNLVSLALGGTIGCQSTVGRGTRFLIDMPPQSPAKKVNTQ